jgi:hypothetical protein
MEPKGRLRAAFARRAARSQKSQIFRLNPRMQKSYRRGSPVQRSQVNSR